MRIAVLGTGLIGGSVGLRAIARGMEVVGYDRDPDVSRRAGEREAVTRVARSEEDAVRGADLVVLAVPVDGLGPLCRSLTPRVPEEAIVTDVGSAKIAAVGYGEAAFGGRFVGGHPMAGSERHGIEAAEAGLLDEASWILTPTAATTSQAYSTVASFVGTLGARPVAVDPVVHDALVARLSHLPQLTASALVHVAIATGSREALLGLAGPGFRDATRIAAGHPDLWVAIIRANRAAVLDSLESLRGRLADVATMVATESWDDLRSFLDRGRAARIELFAKPEYGGAPVVLAMMVPDRPGVLAEVTTAAGRLGANIEDLRIVHSAEGARGRLEVVVAGRASATALAGALAGLGYRVEEMEGN